MALGAQPGDVLKLVMKEGISLALIGVTLGLVAVLAASRLMKSLGRGPLDLDRGLDALAFALPHSEFCYSKLGMFYFVSFLRRGISRSKLRTKKRTLRIELYGNVAEPPTIRIGGRAAKPTPVLFGSTVNMRDHLKPAMGEEFGFYVGFSQFRELIDPCWDLREVARQVQA
jgi:hypothetical protein